MNLKEILKELSIIDSLRDLKVFSKDDDENNFMYESYKKFLLDDKEKLESSLKKEKKRVVFIEEDEKITFEEERGFLWLILILSVLTNDDIDTKEKQNLIYLIEMTCKDLIKKIKKEERIIIKYE